MNENALPFFYTGSFIGRYLRYGDIILSFLVFVCVDIIDACSGTDAFGKYWFVHFDDVFMSSGMQDSNLPEISFPPDSPSGDVPRLFPLCRDFPPGSGFDNKDDATTLTGTQRQFIYHPHGLSLSDDSFPTPFTRSFVTAVPKHLRRIAIPFAILGIGTLLRFYLSGSDKAFQSFCSSDNLSRRIFAEIMPIHFDQNVLEQYLGGIDRGYKTFPHNHAVLVTSTHLLSKSILVFQR